MTVYHNGRYVPKEQASISPEDRGFLFADGVYEVLRAYSGRLFEAEAHVARLRRSLAELRIDWPDAGQVPAIGRRLLESNGLGSAGALLYVQITRGAAPRGHAFPPQGTAPTAYASVSAFEAPVVEMRDGVSAITVSDNRWGRCDIKTVALLPNVLAFQRALDEGTQEAVFVRDGVVTEASHNNVFAVLDGVLATAPLSNLILPGITRQVVLRLCGELGVPVDERPIPEERFQNAEEIFVAGTGSEITPVVRLNGMPVGEGTPGPVTRRLQEAFRLATGQPA
jgi:D-alanine transaminase